MNLIQNDLKIIKNNLYHHVDVLSQKIGERNSYNYTALERAYKYIIETMRSSSFHIKDLEYRHEQLTFHNIVAEKIGNKYPEEIIIIGAHYDTVYNSPGADDNASGIAALLEFIRLYDAYKNQRTMRFVAFTLEEPPFYSTSKMGSHVYAQICKELQENIITMVSLEMLAYFTNKNKSQQYPHPDMVALYPDRGNFIGIVGDEKSKLIVEKITQTVKNYSNIPVESLVAHRAVPGVSLSDHASFWNFGYKAIMVTDTAFYRNPHYHRSDDTIDTLNFKYFSKLVLGLYHSFKLLDLEGI